MWFVLWFVYDVCGVFMWVIDVVGQVIVCEMDVMGGMGIGMVDGVCLMFWYDVVGCFVEVIDVNQGSMCYEVNLWGLFLF